MNYHCGKHDKIYTESEPCPGCVTESSAPPTQQAETRINDTPLRGPDDLIAELRGVGFVEHGFTKHFVEKFRDLVKR